MTQTKKKKPSVISKSTTKKDVSSSSAAQDGKSSSKTAHQNQAKKEDDNHRPAKKRKEEEENAKKEEEDEQIKKENHEELLVEHLPPLPLVVVVLFGSGFMAVLALRDFIATGRSVMGVIDDDMLKFTNCPAFYDNSIGWRSRAGGLSAIASVTTDANNMGGLFVRKVGGAAALTVHLQKLVPLLFHPAGGAQWSKGHFNPMLYTAILGNLMIVAFYGLFYWNDLRIANADGMAITVCCILSFEALMMIVFIIAQKKNLSSATKNKNQTKVFHAIQNGKTPSSVVSRIVARTVALVSSAILLIAGRDLLFPGQIIPFVPYDDIYLEWTGAFIHSPPADSPEDEQYGMEAPLHIGDKFVSQLTALYLIIACMYKFVSAIFIRYGAANDGSGKSGEIMCKMIWKVQTFGDALLLLAIRLFAPAASSASLDIRWHLMCIAYETFILGLYAFF